MKIALRITAALVLLSSLSIWLFHGARIGWTTTEKAVPQVDEITGIEYTEYEKGLNFGVELPIAGTAIAVALLAASVFFKSNQKSNSLPKLS